MLSPSSNKDGAFSAVVTGFTPVSLDYDMNHEFDNVLCNGTGVVDDGDLVPIIGDCSDADKEVDDIACKLHKLQERRMRMVQQWSESSSGVDGQPISGDHSDCHLSSSTSEEQLHDGRHSSDEDPSKRIDVALLRLRQELASLLSGDDAIFDQLLAIRRSISQLKHQYFEDLYEDAELQLLSANDTLSLRRHDSVLKAGSRGVYSRFTPSENNSEDSGISLESSGISSPSMSPSPVGAATAVVPVPSTDGGSVGDHPTAVHRNSVTFPPSRIRQNRYSNGGQRPGLNLSEVGPNGCRSVESHVDLLGEMRTSRDVQKAAMTTKGSRRSLCGPSATPPPPPALLVRSRSVTFLPRGVLVRREDSGVSGRADAPSNGEVFV